VTAKVKISKPEVDIDTSISRPAIDINSQVADVEDRSMIVDVDIERPEDSSHINMIIYGESGSGKTYLGGTAQDCEDASPVLYIDFEGGTETLRGKPIDIVRPKNWIDIQNIYDFLVNENDKYRSVVIDSLTELQKKLSMGSILGELGPDTDRYLHLERAIAPTISDWLRSGEQMRKVMRAFRDLAYLSDRDRRVHVVMLAQEKADDKKGVVCPSLPGALGVDCGAMVDILARLSRRTITDDDGNTTTRSHLLTDVYTDQLDVRYLAKNRGGRLPLSIWDPTIEKILELRNVK